MLATYLIAKIAWRLRCLYYNGLMLNLIIIRCQSSLCKCSSLFLIIGQDNIHVTWSSTAAATLSRRKWTCRLMRLERSWCRQKKINPVVPIWVNANRYCTLMYCTLMFLAERSIKSGNEKLLSTIKWETTCVSLKISTLREHACDHVWQLSCIVDLG